MNTKEITIGSILFDNIGRLIFALQRKGRWFEKENQTYAFFTGIGGRLEQGEAFLECFMREAKEETGTIPNIVVPKTPLVFIDTNDNFRQRALTAEERTLMGTTRPLAIREARISRPEVGRLIEYLIPIYLAQLPDVQVQASDDIPAILSIGFEQLQDYSKGINIETLRRLGGVIVNRPT